MDQVTAPVGVMLPALGVTVAEHTVATLFHRAAASDRGGTVKRINLYVITVVAAGHIGIARIRC
ncbi:MAG: hypothetical protein R3E50_05095 [Halioglobus sp.]